MDICRVRSNENLCVEIIRRWVNAKFGKQFTAWRKKMMSFKITLGKQTCHELHDATQLIPIKHLKK